MDDNSVALRSESGSLRARVSGAEWETRVNLAAAFRMATHLGWNLSTGNHIVARVPDEPEHFLMNAQDFGWHEITASNLLKLDFGGNVIGGNGLRPRPAGLNFHSAILKAKPNLACSFHIHPRDGVVVSAMGEGLMHFDQSSCYLYNQVAYHDFEGIAEEKDEAPRIVSDLGDRHTMIMRNHGLLTVGRTVGEAFVYMNRLIAACEIQVRLLSSRATPKPLPPEICDYTSRQMMRRAGNNPIGETEWKMFLRLAERLDPAFAN